MTQGRDIITRRIFYRDYDRSKIEINVTISERNIFGQDSRNRLDSNSDTSRWNVAFRESVINCKHFSFSNFTHLYILLTSTPFSRYFHLFLKPKNKFMISPHTRTQHIFRIMSQIEIKNRIYFGTKCNRLTVSDRFDSLASSVANWDNSRKSIEISFSPLCGGIGKRGVELSRSTAEVVEAEGLAINFLELRRLRPLLSEKKRQEDLFPR